jgi:hypothetical protein
MGPPLREQTTMLTTKDHQDTIGQLIAVTTRLEKMSEADAGRAHTARSHLVSVVHVLAHVLDYDVETCAGKDLKPMLDAARNHLERAWKLVAA